eukprot:scaffold686_cov245-Skeletonema_marinoi.AAC.33
MQITSHLTSHKFHPFKGQEIDSSDDFEDLDLDLEPSDDLNARLLRPNVATKLRKEIEKYHEDYEHFDIFGADNGIEVFCLNDNNRVKQLKKALRRVARNKVGRQKNLKNQDNDEYHHIKLFNCHIFCPKAICPN